MSECESINEQIESINEQIEIVDAIYEYVESELIGNIREFFRPIFIDEVHRNTVDYISELIIRCEMNLPNHPIQYIGLTELKSKPTTKSIKSKIINPKPDKQPAVVESDDDSIDSSASTISSISSIGSSCKDIVDIGVITQTAIQEVIELYKIPPRSRYEHEHEHEHESTGPHESDNIEHIDEIIKMLGSIKYPAQRSPEWYLSRDGLFSASSMYKVFGSTALLNSLIYEKCNTGNKPVISNAVLGPSEATNPMSWGVKYEAVSAAVYMHKNPRTVVRTDYGCIRHPVYSCIGASPDGINVSPMNPDKYGRMVEIKNIVNRDITGIPKWEYWIQMQFQMEVCRLSKCDFVETRFMEYHSADDFYADHEPEYKGVILYFVPVCNVVNVVNVVKEELFETNAKKDTEVKSWMDYDEPQEPQTTTKQILLTKNEPKIETNDPVTAVTTIAAEFVYMPLYVRCEDPTSVNAYIDEQCNLRKQTHHLSSISYWCLEEYSCVCVDINHAWLNAAIPEVLAAWNIVEKERITGAASRAPNRRIKSEDNHNKMCAF